MDPAQREAGFGFWDFPAAQIPSNPSLPKLLLFLGVVALKIQEYPGKLGKKNLG